VAKNVFTFAGNTTRNLRRRLKRTRPLISGVTAPKRE
jgi:hypothetical protein